MSNDKKSYVTDQGYTKLKEELEHLKKVRRPQIANRIKDAKELGDLSENAEYADAREEQSFTEGRILELEDMMKNIEVIKSSDSNPNVVEIGDTITAKKDGEHITYTIVGSNEANPAEGRISNESPIGTAFLGKSKGDTFSVQTPKGAAEFTVLDINPQT